MKEARKNHPRQQPGFCALAIDQDLGNRVHLVCPVASMLPGDHDHPDVVHHRSSGWVTMPTCSTPT
jgi:hypothetical protein